MNDCKFISQTHPTRAYPHRRTNLDQLAFLVILGV
jgi:hypothetical protein